MSLALTMRGWWDGGVKYPGMAPNHCMQFNLVAISTKQVLSRLASVGYKKKTELDKSQ